MELNLNATPCLRHAGNLMSSFFRARVEATKFGEREQRHDRRRPKKVAAVFSADVALEPHANPWMQREISIRFAAMPPLGDIVLTQKPNWDVV